MLSDTPSEQLKIIKCTETKVVAGTPCYCSNSSTHEVAKVGDHCVHTTGVVTLKCVKGEADCADIVDHDDRCTATNCTCGPAILSAGVCYIGDEPGVIEGCGSALIGGKVTTRCMCGSG